MKDIVLGLIRHLLTAGGGYLVAHDVATQADATAFAVAAAPVLVGIIWSVAHKLGLKI